MQWQCECVCECFDVALEHVLVQMNQPSLLPPFDIGHHHLATNPIDNSDIKWATTTTTATQLNVLTLYQLLNTNNHRCSPIACWYTLHISPKSPFPPFLRATIIVAEIEHCNWCNNLASFWRHCWWRHHNRCVSGVLRDTPTQPPTGQSLSPF